jgi:hypothetical protein
MCRKTKVDPVEPKRMISTNEEVSPPHKRPATTSSTELLQGSSSSSVVPYSFDHDGCGGLNVDATQRQSNSKSFQVATANETIDIVERTLSQLIKKNKELQIQIKEILDQQVMYAIPSKLILGTGTDDFDKERKCK